VGHACAWAGLLLSVTVLAVGILFIAQHATEEPEEAALVQDLQPTVVSGTVVLSFSSASLSVRAGAVDRRIRVESDFDGDVFQLEQDLEVSGDGDWTYRLDFHEKKLLHVSVVGIWVGRKRPEVVVELPRDLPLALEAEMQGGYLALDLAGLALTSADLELDRGVLGVIVSQPLETAMERLHVKGRIGTVILRSLGDASPRELRVHHGVGAASVNLEGAWRTDARVDFAMTLGRGDLILPQDVRIEGLGRDMSRRAGDLEESDILPTLRVTTRSKMGKIRIVD
jgi:hypothetical protein